MNNIEKKLELELKVSFHFLLSQWLMLVKFR
jgi:hypothetical protein